MKNPSILTSGRLGRREFLLRSASSLALWSLPWRLGACSTAARRKTASAAAQQPLYWAWWGWEPLDHYRRTGGIVGAVDTNAPWLEPWYDRLHSEEIVRLMADLGINLGVTHFFKGFGLRHERPEQQRTAHLVKFAHRHGIKILGYCQSRSLYHEQFLAEVPNAEAWIQRDEHGQLRFWGGKKFRWAPCIQSREFRDYLKRTIRVGLEETGLDGLHFDNNYAPPCYCSRCEQAFRRWLQKRFPNPQQRFGRDSLRDIRQPVLPKSLARITDPLLQEWIRWRCESLAEYQAELEAYARRVKPHVILLGNPGFPRRPTDAHANSIWAPWQGRHLDLMFAENANFPGLQADAMISQVRAFKYGAAIGYRVVSTVWKHDKLTGLGLPDTEAEIALQIAESAAAHNAVPGTNWALRPLGDGNKMRVERPDLREALARYLRFVRTHESLRQNARPVTDIALLHTFASTVFDNLETVSLTSGAEEILIRAGFAWEALYDEHLHRLKQFSVLVLAGQSHLTDSQITAIRSFAATGGSLILAGDNGRYDETGRERLADPFADLRAERLPADVVRAPAGSAYAQRVLLPHRWKEFAAALIRAARNRFSARLSGSDTVTLSPYEVGPNRLVIHLVNYAPTHTTPALRLELGPRWQRSRRARFLSPDAPERLLSVRPVMDIPSFKTYALLELQL